MIVIPVIFVVVTIVIVIVTVVVIVIFVFLFLIPIVIFADAEARDFTSRQHFIVAISTIKSNRPFSVALNLVDRTNRLFPVVDSGVNLANIKINLKAGRRRRNFTAVAFAILAWRSEERFSVVTSCFHLPISSLHQVRFLVFHVLIAMKGLVC